MLFLEEDLLYIANSPKYDENYRVNIELFSS
ncbi:hypothetical protein FHS70_005256 [Flammeovirga yaeyamensis]|nr:hypothetical protein [Flammeovirga yaeyamensis]